MNDWLKECKKLSIKIEQDSLKTEIHKSRSKTLGLRVKSIFECIASLDPKLVNLNDTRVKACFSMLLVCFEEICDYFSLLLAYSKTLGKRVEKFGSDEEAFSKWNETLQTCAEELNLPLEKIFDNDVDLDDFNRDMEDLNAKLKFILEKVVNLFGSVELAVEANQKLLAQQQTDRTLYKTQKAVKTETTFDTKAIKYEKVIGRGGRVMIQHRFWRGLESSISRRICCYQDSSFLCFNR